MKYNGVTFKGQYKRALISFLEGETIELNNFDNGAWEPTVQIQEFIRRLDKVGLAYNLTGKSIRQYKIKRI